MEEISKELKEHFYGKDHQFSILEKCYNAGLLNYVNITPEFKAEMNRHLFGIEPPNWRELSKNFGNDLKKLDYIDTVVNIFDRINTEADSKHWTEYVFISARIKPNGLLFFTQWKYAKSQEKSNKWSAANIAITATVAVLTFIGVVYQKIVEGINKNDKQQIEILKSQLSQQSTELHQLRSQINQLTSHEGLSHKH